MPAPEDSRFALWDLIFIGYSLNFLCQASPDLPLGPSHRDQLGVVGHCRELLEKISQLELRDCDWTVRASLEDFLMEQESLLETNANANLGDGFVKLRQLMSDCFEAMQRETSPRDAFVTMPQREFAVKKMLVDPPGWFGLAPDSRLRSMPACVADDFKQAARCFAAGFSASAIIFAYRATEGTLYVYYELITGQERPSTLMWEGVLKQLEGKYGCDAGLVNGLRRLKEQRNSAMHPGCRDPEQWGHEAARRVIVACREAVGQMDRDLTKRLGPTTYFSIAS